MKTRIALSLLVLVSFATALLLLGPQPRVIQIEQWSAKTSTSRQEPVGPGDYLTMNWVCVPVHPDTCYGAVSYVYPGEPPVEFTTWLPEYVEENGNRHQGMSVVMPKGGTVTLWANVAFQGATYNWLLVKVSTH